MNETSRPIGPQPWESVRTRLDETRPFANMAGTPYYRDAVYEQFSREEYGRRYAALRAKMREHRLDCMIVPGGPSHWSYGAGMLWLTGHWEWHALAAYVLVPLEEEPTLIYAMGGTHAEAVRRVVAPALSDVRHSRNGRYAEVMVERLRELKLERGRIGLMEIDPRHNDYLPVNQYEVLRKSLPEAELVFTKGFLHQLLCVHSAEELECVRKAGRLCQKAMEAMVARAAPGVQEWELKAAAGSAILEGGGDIDFLIIGSTPMANPAMVFGNPRPSQRVLAKGDIIIMELAAGYRGYTAQIGSPITIGQPTDTVRKFWNEIVLPGYHRIVAEIAPGKPAENMRLAARFFREKGVQSRPTQCHGIDLVTDHPHVNAQEVHQDEHDKVLKPGMVIMAEPNPITADGTFGIFLGHTFIVTETGRECVDDFPLEIAVAGS
ncbi:MAG TPA: Xaa-Pro peptidase family protein [Hyphomicrobiaceae bacterium]|nr:Xaa-Pro peptidase family protein [Hyphomicrobiaceae bacterium]